MKLTNYTRITIVSSQTSNHNCNKKNGANYYSKMMLFLWLTSLDNENDRQLYTIYIEEFYEQEKWKEKKRKEMMNMRRISMEYYWTHTIFDFMKIEKKGGET